MDAGNEVVDGSDDDEEEDGEDCSGGIGLLEGMGILLWQRGQRT